MKNLSHFDEKSQSFWPSQVGRYGLSVLVFTTTSDKKITFACSHNSFS